MIHTDRVADTALVVSGGSFLTAHWFLVTDQLLHMGAEIVSIATGIGALCYYIPKNIHRVYDWYLRWRAKVWSR